MRGIKIIGILLVLGMSSGCQVKSERYEPEKLTELELRKAFVGKTVESFNLISGSTSFTYYHPDGRVEQERYWERRTGFWKVNAQSEICLSMEGKPFSCRGVYKENKGLYKYRLNNEGEKEKIIRYRQFIVGNALE